MARSARQISNRFPRKSLRGGPQTRARTPRAASLRIEALEARDLLSMDPVFDIRPGSADAGIRIMATIGDTVYFAADDGVHGSELWKSDGTAAGTSMVKDIRPGASSSDPGKAVISSVLSYTNFSATVIGGILYFAANDGANGVELWRSDGTEAGTSLVKNINPGSAGSTPAELLNVDGVLYFSANDGVRGQELWKSDGTSAGTVLVSDVFPINNWPFFNGSHPRQLTPFNGNVYFTGISPAGPLGLGQQTQLYVSDGTPEGTLQISDIPPKNEYGANTSISGLTNVGYGLLFSADGAEGSALWGSDGTEAGTGPIKDISPSGADAISGFVRVDSSVLFSANDGVHGSELWKTDGTAAGTVLVSDYVPGPTGFSPTNFVSIENSWSLAFAASSPNVGTELFRSYGYGGTTSIARDIWPGANSSAPSP